MKKLLFISLLFISIGAVAQTGIKGLKADPIIDPNGSISSFTWTQTSGSPFKSITTTNAVGSPIGLQDSVTIISSIAGTYTLDGTVVDNQGNSSTYTNYITFTAYQNKKPQMLVNPASSPTNPIIVPIK